MEYLFLILGIMGLITNANSWFIVPDIVIYVCFGFSIIIFIMRMILFNSINKKFKKRW